jgi:hypothetical protein
MTDKTNVITVTAENLDWINKNVPGSSKQKRLEEILRTFKDRRGISEAIFRERLPDETLVNDFGKVIARLQQGKTKDRKYRILIIEEVSQ